MAQAVSPASIPDNNRGEYYHIVAWCMTAAGTIAVLLRLYARLVLAGHPGFDDALIVVALLLTIIGNAGDTVAVDHGLGRHQIFLNEYQYSGAVKWMYLNFLFNFICFFFLRASVMFFVLRLLAKTKRWPPRFIWIAMFLNFAITMIAVVTYGIRCIPFKAIYLPVDGAQCMPVPNLVIAMTLNGGLACIVDFITALVPMFLLWGVRMKKKTKVTLYIFLAMGVLTAGCSIGRAATLKQIYLTEDTTWHLIPTYMFGLFEEKTGIIIACLPALRQLVVSISRNHSALPHSRHQSSYDDSESPYMRFRRKHHMVSSASRASQSIAGQRHRGSDENGAESGRGEKRKFFGLLSSRSHAQSGSYDPEKTLSAQRTNASEKSNTPIVSSQAGPPPPRPYPGRWTRDLAALDTPKDANFKHDTRYSNKYADPLESYPSRESMGSPRSPVSHSSPSPDSPEDAQSVADTTTTLAPPYTPPQALSPEPYSTRRSHVARYPRAQSRRTDFQTDSLHAAPSPVIPRYRPGRRDYMRSVSPRAQTLLAMREAKQRRAADDGEDVPLTFDDGTRRVPRGHVASQSRVESLSQKLDSRHSARKAFSWI